jgi:hypothetical protein
MLRMTIGGKWLEPQGMIPWRANIHWAFVADLAYFPLQFLEFAIQGCILAEAYRHRPQSQPMIEPIRTSSRAPCRLS